MWLLQEGVQQESEAENPHDTSYRGEAVQMQSRLRKRIPKPRPTRRPRADASRRERVPVHSLPEDVHEDIKPESSCEEARREEGASVRRVWKSFCGAGRSSKLQTQWEKMKKKKLQRFAMEIPIRSWPQQNTTLVVYNWTIGNRGIGKNANAQLCGFGFRRERDHVCLLQTSALQLGWECGGGAWRLLGKLNSMSKTNSIAKFKKMWFLPNVKFLLALNPGAGDSLNELFRVKGFPCLALSCLPACRLNVAN